MRILCAPCNNLPFSIFTGCSLHVLEISKYCSTHAVLRQQNFCRWEWYVCVEQRVFWDHRKMSGDDDDHAARDELNVGREVRRCCRRNSVGVPDMQSRTPLVSVPRLYGRRLFVRIVSTSALWAVDLGRPSSGGLLWRWPTSVTDSVNESASPRVAYRPIQSISLTDRRHTWLVNRAVTVSKPNHLIYSVYSIHARAPVLCSAQFNTMNSHCILSGEFCVTSDPLAYVT